ncbi:hypothetical protein NI385_04820 [Vibrio parahaemolyticus]|uniref:DUF6414 family protein n=1 Tax=Vibrio sp. 1291-1 TaxID=3074551 RepID=UPI001DD9EED7|nr:hypothetical protein [Vibrio sp. 1291-1]EGR1568044.1 hypothetical protein [Vibrio parahaemolyticus]EKA5860791.1 hypothetical protein [Vibrio alginolyticus]MDW3637983.1 hypothetical protein [Vibrio sp. 1291-1]WMN76083.1 hypothetical protein NI385_04820 [Vibrio parahaemolyticus]
MIKNFIYLDEPKLYSFSSQLFEGVTEYVLNEQHQEHTDEEKQKGKLASGRVIADVIKEASTSTTKKFLHDHSFNLFENELKQSDNLLDVSSNQHLTFSDICGSGKSFIRIRAKGKFVDLSEIRSIFTNYTNIAEAIAILPLVGELQEFEQRKAENPKSPSVKSEQSKIDKLIKQRVAELSANLPQISVKSFEAIIDNFGDDIIRFKQQTGDVTFTTTLTSDHLRDELRNIVRKYSRKTAKEFTVLGFISHGDGTQQPDIREISEGAPMLRHMEGLAENLFDLEQTFGAKGDNEIMIEPVAIYTEL